MNDRDGNTGLVSFTCGIVMIAVALSLCGSGPAPRPAADAGATGCLMQPGLVPEIATGAEVPLAAGDLPHRIVVRFIIVRMSDGSGGLDESLLHYYMRDLNVGYRDTPFVFVQHPEILYIDNDTHYNNIPGFGVAIPLMAAYQEPGVVVHIVAPSLVGSDNAITGMNFVSNPRGNIVQYSRIGNPNSIVFPPHEMGHVFWLYHPFETQFGLECTSGSNCLSQGDLVCDTPASMAVHGNNTTATGIYYAVDPGPCLGDPIYAPLTDLYMEAGWPAGHILRDRFTDGQIMRSLTTLFTVSQDLIGPERPDILVDCDGNGLDDVEEILAGDKADLNRDMVPDTCQVFPRAGDLLVSGMSPDDLNRVRYFDGATGAFRETMWNGMTWVHQLRMGPDGLAYLARLTIVQRLDFRTGRTVDNFLDGVLDGAGTFVDLLFEPDGNLLVLDNVARNIQRYDGTTGAFLGVFSDFNNFGFTSPKYMEYGPDGDIFVVGNGAGGSGILRVDAQTGALGGSLITPGAGGLSAGQGITLHDGLFYVSNAGANNVLRFDAVTGAFAGEFVSPGSGGLSNPHSLRFGPDGHLYVASRGDDSVKKYDGATGASLGDFVAPRTDGLDDPTGLLFVPRNPGDVTGDGTVGISDLLQLLADWGPCPDPCPPCAADFDADCTVGIGDFLTLLANWTQ